MDAAAFREPLREARAEVRRRHAHRVQAARLPRPLGRSLPDAVEGLRGGHRAPAGRVRARGARLPRQEAGALVPHAPHGAGRGRGRVRGPRLAVDLCALPGRRRSGEGRRAAQGEEGGVRHLDHDPLDAAGQPGGGRQSRARLRGDPARRRISDRRGWAGRGVPGGDRHRRAEGVLDRDLPRRAAGAGRDALRAAVPAPELRRRQGLPALVRPPRHARGRHRARPHRARSRRRRLRRRSRPRPHDLRARRRERPLHRRGRARRAQRRAGVRRQPEDRRAAGRARPPAEQGGRDDPPPVPLLLALQEPDHLPRHAAVVRAARRGGRREVAAPPRAGGDRADAVDPDLGREPHPRHDRGAPRLVPVAPARLGGADPGVSLHALQE